MTGEVILSANTFNAGRIALNNSYSGTASFNNVIASGGLTGSTIYIGDNNLYNIFHVSGSTILSITPGSNISTGGTPQNPSINVVASPIFTSINVTGSTATNFSNISGNTITGGTVFSSVFSGSSLSSTTITAGTIYSSVFSGGTVTASTITATAVKANSITSTTINANSITGTSISGATLFSGTTNLGTIINNSATQFWSSSTGSNSLMRSNLNNLASGPSSVVLSTGSTASGPLSVAAGANSLASGVASFTEGSGTTAAGSYSHAEGFRTVASGSTSHSEGYDTKAVGNYSHSGGLGAIAFHYAEWARSHMYNSQYGIMSVSASTTNNTPTTLNAGGSYFTVGVSEVYRVEVSVTALNISTFDAKEWKGFGIIKNVGGTTSLVSAISMTSTYADAGMGTASVATTANNTNDRLEITATGIAATNINWFAKIEYIMIRI